MYLLVEFVDSNEVAVVPECWVSDGFASWPVNYPGAKLNASVKQQISPSQEWETYKVRELYRNEVYDEVRLRLKKAEEDSDLNTTADSGSDDECRKSKRKKRTKVFSSDEDEIPPEDLTALPKIPKPVRCLTGQFGLKTPASFKRFKTSTEPRSPPESPHRVATPRRTTEPRSPPGSPHRVATPRRTTEPRSPLGSLHRVATPRRTTELRSPPESPQLFASPTTPRRTSGHDAGPSTGAIAGPSSGAIARPSTGAIAGPSTGAIARPSTGAIARPSTGAIAGPSTGAIARPSTGAIARPSTGAIAGPSTGAIARPSTGAIARPSTGAIAGPSTGDIAGPTATAHRQPGDIIAARDIRLFTLMERMLERQAAFDVKVDQVLLAVQSLAGTRGHTDILAPPEDVTLPVTSPEELDRLEDKLADEATRNGMANYLSIIGGRNVRDLTRRILAKCLTNALAARYNLSGQKGKLRFGKTYLSATIEKAVMKNFDVTVKTVEEEQREWFRTAKDRSGGREERRRTTTTT